MTTNDSNELEVKYVENQEIQESLRKLNINNIDLSFVMFVENQIERAVDNTDSSNNSGDAAVAGGKMEFTNGKAVNIVTIMNPITQAMSVQTGDLDDRKKEQIKAKADKSKEAKEREGLGE